MVTRDENSAICIIQNKLPNSKVSKITLLVRPSYTVAKLFADIRRQLEIADNFELILERGGKTDFENPLLENNNKTLSEVGLEFDRKVRTTIIVAESYSSVKANIKIPIPPPEPTIFVTNTNNITSNAVKTKCNFSPNPKRLNGDVTLPYLSPTLTNIDGECEPMITDQSPEVSTTNTSITDTNNIITNNHNNVSGADGDYSHNTSIKYEPEMLLPQELPDEPTVVKGIIALPFVSNAAYKDGEKIESSSGSQAWDSHATTNASYSGKYIQSSRQTHGYVGLVNQAMTCYLNSLLQALFMTPEFRNALYDWEFDGQDEVKSIPYQLQKLFLNLQTSQKVAVETTDLTQSFGWDSSEAWQQHDIQELCRILFDALEQKFKATEHADLIKQLYEGKMMDYVKCLECSTEKSREDSFLDIPLPVRPFGSTTAYENIDDALSAFVQPETLDGTNQYFCEKCNKKCDAHKGLKFTKFPYILTLHLKRFDFDYQTFHRIKLNDRVSFPETLHLNRFINDMNCSAFVNSATTVINENGTNVSSGTSGNGSASSEHGSIESAIKFDDCSTTDSGSALEEETSTFGGVGGSGNGVNIDCALNGGTNEGNGGGSDLQEDDEGIDMTSSTDNNKCSSIGAESGPYIYELFAIMIHSGSASGGHYYAYIKDFDNEDWYCFNDQTVSPASQEDIEKSFGGGGSLKTYYSAAYSSSTNAYMLMYRQVDPARNTFAVKPNKYPKHINDLLKRLKDKEETDRKNRANEEQMTRYRVYFSNPKTNKLQDARIYMTSDATLELLLEDSHSHLKVNNFAPIERCRLVAYNHFKESIIRSFDGQEKQLLHKLMRDLEPLDLLLEIREENETFEPIIQGSELLKVYKVDMETADIDGPTMIRAMITGTVKEFRELLSQKLSMPFDSLSVAALTNCSGSIATHLSVDELTLATEEVKNRTKIFVTSLAKTPANEQKIKKFVKIVERSEHVITLHFSLPNTDRETLEKLSIPSYEENHHLLNNNISNNDSENESMQIALTTESTTNLYNNGIEMKTPTTTPPTSSATTPNLTLPFSSTSADCVDAVMNHAPTVHRLPVIEQQFIPLHESELCNSEDSSLSDGDKTLVDTAPDLADISSTNNSPSCSDAHLSDPDIAGANFNTILDNYPSPMSMSRTYYFKATPYETPGTEERPEPQKMLKVLVDTDMIMGNLKLALEPHVRVPKEYFKIFRSPSLDSETECTRLTETVGVFKDNERLTIELGRALRDGEYKCKIYLLLMSEIFDDFDKMPVKCDWILRMGANIGQTKRDIISQLATQDPSFNISYEHCRLRKKTGKYPADIYNDKDKFGDQIRLSENFEMILQIVENTSIPFSPNTDFCLFIRRWHPSTMVFGGFDEIVVYENSDVKQLISELSNIPIERIEYVRLNTYSRSEPSILNFHTSVNWSSNAFTVENFYSFRTGDVYVYRDTAEQLKELTPEEKRELTNKERQPYGTMFNSPRRERALKIYLDSSPKKVDYDI